MNVRFLILAPLLVLLTLTANAQGSATNDPVAALEADYQAKLEAEARDLRFLEGRYVEALGKLKQEAQQAGKLDEFVAVETELKSHADTAERDFSSMPKLNQLRAIFEKARAPIAREVALRQAPIHLEFSRKFGELARELTRQNRLDDAIRANRWVEKSNAAASETTLAGPVPFGEAREPSLLWRLERNPDMEPHDVNVDREGDVWVLTCRKSAGGMLETDQKFDLPVTLKARVATDSTNIRFYFNRTTVTIFNWEMRVSELRIHNPATNSNNGIGGEGSLETNVFHDIEIDVTTGGVAVRVDGKERAHVDMEVGDLKGTAGIGPAFGSEVRVEQFEVHRFPDPDAGK